MYKTIDQSSYSFGVEPVTLVKMSSRGIIGDDLSSFVKRAGHFLADKLDHIEAYPGERLIHVIGLGSTETYGPNRNGDGFSRKMLAEYMPTFTKYARWYYDHKNNDPGKSYGRIAWAGYNPEMHRGELIVALNATKEAAERNGGFIAERTLNTIDKGDCPPTSMSIKVPYDRCSFCNKIAASRAEYCDEHTCSGFGCKHNLTKVASDGRVQFVHNDRGAFFDMSDVNRNADRISFALGELSKFDKSASVFEENAEGIFIPEHSISQSFADPMATKYAHTLSMLIDKESRIGHDLEENAWSLAFSSACRPKLSPCPVELNDGRYLKQAMHALAAEKIVLPVEAWLPLVAGTKSAEIAVEVKPYLPMAYSNMLCSDQAASLLEDNPYEPSQEIPPHVLRLWAKHAAAGYSLDQTLATRRLQLGIISDIPPVSRQRNLLKAASYDTSVEQLANHYAAYTVAATRFIQKQAADFSLICDFVVRQNWVR